MVRPSVRSTGAGCASPAGRGRGGRRRWQRRPALRRTCRPAGRSSCPSGRLRGSWYLPPLTSKMNSRRNAWWSSLRSVLSPCGKSSPSFISRPSSASISFIGVLAALELRLLHADLERVHRLVVRLHVAVGQRAGRIDLLQPRLGLVEELLVVRRVERRVEHRDVAVDADEAVDLVAERRQVGRFRDRAVAGPLVLLGQAEIEGLVADGHAVLAEEDAEQAVEIAADLGQERRHVGGAERNAGGADDLAARLLDLLRRRRRGSTGPRSSRHRRCATSCPSC